MNPYLSPRLKVFIRLSPVVPDVGSKVPVILNPARDQNYTVTLGERRRHRLLLCFLQYASLNVSALQEIQRSCPVVCICLTCTRRSSTSGGPSITKPWSNSLTHDSAHLRPRTPRLCVFLTSLICLYLCFSDSCVCVCVCVCRVVSNEYGNELKERVLNVMDFSADDLQREFNCSARNSRGFNTSRAVLKSERNYTH